MVHLTRIYTGTGDDGTTALVNGDRVRKTDPRLIAYADVNETNAVIGLALPHCDDPLISTLRRIQNDLFDLGADLAMPLSPDEKATVVRVSQQWITELEADCDRYGEGLAPLHSFILPGGSIAASHLHHSCTVARRAERSAWAAQESYGDGAGGVNRFAPVYLNRLSDLLFICARYANRKSGDVLWRPGGGRLRPPRRRSRQS